MENENWTYFQWNQEAGYPVYVRCDLTQFGAEMLTLLAQMRFTEIEPTKLQEVQQHLDSNPYGRVLSIKQAGQNVAKQIDQVAESDRYGAESIVPKEGYNVYRYRGVGLLVYAFSHMEWELGCFNSFGKAEDRIIYHSIMNRFLSWALAPLGVIGFWGVPVDEGMVVLRQKESRGETVYLDVKKRKLLSLDGVSEMKPRFKILRLDPNLNGRNIKMSSEELLCFLSVQSTYFDYRGLSVPVRQLICTLAVSTEGLVHPQESFKPRTDLSL